MQPIRLLFSAILFAAASFAVNADVIINVEELAGDVVFTGSGSINRDNTVGTFGAGGGSLVAPITGRYQNIAGPSDSYFIEAVSRPGSIGPGGPAVPALGFTITSVGDLFGITGAGIRVHELYVSGTELSFQTTFVGETLLSLGINTGSYVWTTINDTITMNITSAVPAPAAIALFGFGLIGMALARRR